MKLTSNNIDIMVIFMPHYRQHGQFYHSRSRSSTNSNAPISNCKFGSNIVCRFVFSLLLLIIAFFIFELSIENLTNQREGTMIIALILLIIAFISFIRTIQTVRRYDLMMKTRRRWNERLETTSDLPSYKELFPSHLDLQTNGNHQQQISPPSYNDFLKTFGFHSTEGFRRGTVTHV